MAKPDGISALSVELAQKIFTLRVQLEDDYALERAIDLSHVSRHWREIALGTHALWTNIIVSSAYPGPAALNTYLARAGPLPLHLHLHFRLRRDDEESEYYDEDIHFENKKRMHSLLNVVKHYIGQLRVLSITSTESYTFKMFEKMFKNAAAPLLEALALQCLRPARVYSSEYGEGQFLGGTPSLKTYCFRGLALSYVTFFPSPKHLYLSDGLRGGFLSQPGHMRELLEKYAALQHLSVQTQIFRPWPVNLLPSPPVPVQMEFLHTLILCHRYREQTGIGGWDCDLLLKFIRAPNLKTLAFIDMLDDDLELSARASAPPRFPTVETLAIIRPIAYISWKKLLKHAPIVSHLILIYIDVGDDEFEQAFIDSTIDLCPDSEDSKDDSNEPNSQPITKSVLANDLQTLTIHPVDMDILCMLVEGRKSRGHPISKVRMEISSLDEEDTARLPSLREHVEIENFDPYEIVAEFERGLHGASSYSEKPNFLFV